MRDVRGEGSAVDVDSLVEWMAAKLDRHHGTHVSSDAAALDRLRDAATKAVRDLEDTPEVHINVPFIATNAAGEPVHVEEIMTRTALKNLFAPQPHPHPHAPPPPPSSKHADDALARARAKEREKKVTSIVVLVFVAIVISIIALAITHERHDHDDHRGKHEGR